METAGLINFDALQRDWIVGTTGQAFYPMVQRCVEQIEAGGDDASVRGVMILESDPVRFAAAFFAAVHAGVPVILANPKWQRVEWERVVTLVNPAVVFGNSPISDAARSGITHPKAGTILIPTGGSSGGVKFAMHRWATLVAACEGVSSFIGPGAINSCCVLPLYHVSGLMQLVRSFATEGRIVFPDFKELLAGHFPDFPASSLCLSLVPTQLQRLMAQQRLTHRLMAMRAIFVGGASIPGSVEQRARELKLPVVLSYGMTETAAMVTALPPDEFLAGHTNVGRPLSHALVKVIRDDGSVCPVGEIGHVRINAKSLFLGYHQRPASISRIGYLTDDEGTFDSLGRLHIVGRSDRLIISGGEKIDPHEVEQAIMDTGAVEQVLVIGWPDAEWGQKLVAFYIPDIVVSHEGKWEEELRADLANYKIPKQMIQVPILPLNERGKVDRKLMEQLIASSER
ncbi:MULTISPECIES: AMP-binding protein [unclassified Lentimonas]|uniref:AMP-binding protein n=1 Tax=unclassified Lentimonas TaxID=2630993 RepID=UPI0013260BEB|nr:MULTISPECIES: AMP-binding protein [unclassified Lentimonas]CAA6676581.1 O-succinylbenzoic acid--CoA ligase (EC [Lentimonas sp. CC4]CAA6684755.1 O-succinylbenzoic acid--CoA ligase (EC [Lentimonas sp. CC6]CAA6692037.1 O-succinylbenzoic acid--CoA ligase (EC [Lentimonas sp. CC10]CAA6694032.1 O-succinylbenzoic acid--CoA ligase (EC [Lentimonas sp. CC19]CAA7070278.1 O-succinylbenzoic acid--CoA ligase (EC [Lentimonas sp. CC11]